MKHAVLSLALLAFVLPIASATTIWTSETTKEYVERIAKWRKEQEADLLKPEGFLSVAGLFWLKDGINTIGSDPSSSIVLPHGSAPAKVGTLSLIANHVLFTAAGGANPTIGGEVTQSKDLAMDKDRVVTGSVTFMVIRRGSRTGVRLFDPNCKGRREFTGQKWFPVNPKYLVHAKYTAYDTPKSLPITNVLGDTSMVSNPGYVTFTVDGKECHLEAQAQGDGFFFNFKDLTSGNTTYPAGRFLDAPRPVNGEVTLDFNQATNPPCAFTSFATCPLPPRANFMTVAILAGEKTHHPVEK